MIGRGPQDRIWMVLLLPAFIGGCQPGLNRQPRISRPDTASSFFSDGRANRPIERGTVARGQLDWDPPKTTGKIDDRYVVEFPVSVDEALLVRGRERFNIYCAQCHDRLGEGNGKVVARGYIKPPSFHTDDSRGLKLRGQIVKLTDAPIGYLFEVITQGMGAMPDHTVLVSVDDRWAIISYIRALQYTEHTANAK